MYLFLAPEYRMTAKAAVSWKYLLIIRMLPGYTGALGGLGVGHQLKVVVQGRQDNVAVPARESLPEQEVGETGVLWEQGTV